MRGLFLRSTPKQEVYCRKYTFLNRQQLILALQNYQTSNQEEESFRSDFLQLLTHPRAYYRDHLPGHITGSAWIIDHKKECVLLTHHAKLQRWLQPGGHADGEENIMEVALKEAKEETGLSQFTINGQSFFDIDIHTIPARGDFPEHLHFDIRFLIQANPEDELTITEESLDLQWIPLNEVGIRSGENTSMLRMAAKTKALFTGDQ